jgi:hypothetical protein
MTTISVIRRPARTSVILLSRRRSWTVTVRAEAGWDRTSPAWAFPNQLRIADIPLDTAAANIAAAIRARTGVS